MSRRLVRTVLVPLFVAVALFVVPLALVSVQDNKLQLIELAEQHAARTALVASTTRESGAVDEQILELPILGGERVAVFDDRGRVIADTGRGPLTLPPDLREQALAGLISGTFEGERQRVVATAPIMREGEVEGLSVAVLVADELVARSRVQLITLGASALGLLLVAGYAARVVARSVVRPVVQLDQTAVRLAAGDLTARAPVDDGPPELRRLATTLNSTAARLQELLAAQRAFVADVSHQLRTPLTSLRLRLEGMEMSGVAPERIAAVSGEVDRLTRLVEQLLTLARVEGGKRPRVPVDVAGVVAERIASWQPLADHNGVVIESRIARGLPDVHMIDGALEQILDNYLSNALRVAPQGSTVDVETYTDADGVVCRVADRGPGLSAEERRQAFERFWQGRATPRDGSSGLGLSIVAELAKANDAVVALHEREGGGLVAEVRLLRATSATSPGDNQSPERAESIVTTRP